MTHDNVTDIVGRLRNFALNTLALIPDKLQQYPKTDPDLIIKGFSHQCDLLTEAADTIATLRKQLENARSEALEEAAKAIRDEQDRLDAEAGDYLMDPTDCIDVIEALKVPQ